jgi:hypothetical protein
MSNPTTGQASPGAVDRARDTVARTRFAVRTALGRTDGRLVFGGVALGYLLTYLWAIQDLLPGGFGQGIVVVSDPLAVAFRRTAALSFEAVALIDLGVVSYEFSPVNLLIGLVVAGLVGVNIAVSYLVWRQPAACGISPEKAVGTGLMGAIPALLSGTACCGPLILLVVGIQMTTALVTLFSVLLPIAVVALVGSLLYVGRQVNPALA